MANTNEFTVDEKQNALDDTIKILNMKVFRMDDYQWIAHYSAEEALAFYHSDTGVPIDDLKQAFDDWGEVPLTETMFWEATDITDEEANMAGVEYVGQTAWGDSYSVTFEWVLQNRTHKYPGYIACTECQLDRYFFKNIRARTIKIRPIQMILYGKTIKYKKT